MWLFVKILFCFNVQDTKRQDPPPGSLPQAILSSQQIFLHHTKPPSHNLYTQMCAARLLPCREFRFAGEKGFRNFSPVRRWILPLKNSLLETVRKRGFSGAVNSQSRAGATEMEKTIPTSNSGRGNAKRSTPPKWVSMENVRKEASGRLSLNTRSAGGSAVGMNHTFSIVTSIFYLHCPQKQGDVSPLQDKGYNTVKNQNCKFFKKNNVKFFTFFLTFCLN